MVGIVIVTAALTSGTYNGYDLNAYSVAITGFFVIVTIVMTAVWYRTKYDNPFPECAHFLCADRCESTGEKCEHGNISLIIRQFYSTPPSVPLFLFPC